MPSEMTFKEKIKKILKKLANNLQVDYDKWLSAKGVFEYRPQKDKLLKQAISSILAEIEKELGEEKTIIKENKSPKPDILNDCEVRREGYNDCLAKLKKRLRG